MEEMFLVFSSVDTFSPFAVPGKGLKIIKYQYFTLCTRECWMIVDERFNPKDDYHLQLALVVWKYTVGRGILTEVDRIRLPIRMLQDQWDDDIYDVAENWIEERQEKLKDNDDIVNPEKIAEDCACALGLFDENWTVPKKLYRLAGETIL